MIPKQLRRRVEPLAEMGVEGIRRSRQVCREGEKGKMAGFRYIAGSMAFNWCPAGTEYLGVGTYRKISGNHEPIS